MILKLNGADFSEKNIGKINISSVSKYTKDIISKYSRSITREQMYALQDFIDSAKLLGAWDKIEYLYLPILAGSTNEIFVNVKSLSTDSTTGEFEVSDIGATGSGAVIPFDFVSNDLHIGFYNTDTFSPDIKTTCNFTMFDKTIDSVRHFVRYRNITDNEPLRQAYNTSGNVQISNSASWLGNAQYHGVNIKSDGLQFFADTHFTGKMNSSNFAEGYTITGQSLAINLIGAHYGMIVIGKALDDFSEFRKIVDTFMAKFI